MNRAQLIIANAGGAAGLAASFTWTGAAQFFAAVATGAWMVAQTVVLLRRQRCNVRDCPSRQG